MEKLERIMREIRIYENMRNEAHDYSTIRYCTDHLEILERQKEIIEKGLDK